MRTNENPPVLIQLAQSCHPKLPIVPEEDLHAPSPLQLLQPILAEESVQTFVPDAQLASQVAGCELYGSTNIVTLLC